MLTKYSFVFLLIIYLLLPLKAEETTDLFNKNTSIKALAMGGTAVGLADFAGASAYNPASLGLPSGTK